MFWRCDEAKKLHKSSTDRKLFGVCGGLAEYFQIDSTIVRLIWIVLTVCAGLGVLTYFLFALCMPKDTDDKDSNVDNSNN